ncbi:MULTISPECIES: hypothetical protein [unclassified Shewanella]|uniref:hypothetical protein n=1 Tax=unclassified Shewanella TaxID=196818 RepID=UPI001C7CA7AB|nr:MULTISPECIES: hypothetical protein [unclassified Shewanella]
MSPIANIPTTFSSAINACDTQAILRCILVFAFTAIELKLGIEVFNKMQASISKDAKYRLITHSS